MNKYLTGGRKIDPPKITDADVKKWAIVNDDPICFDPKNTRFVVNVDKAVSVIADRIYRKVGKNYE